jgi:hypothetical protein
MRKLMSHFVASFATIGTVVGLALASPALASLFHAPCE